MSINSDNQASSTRKWIEYAALAMALVLVMFILSISGARTGARAQPTQTDVGNLYAGDWNVKLYFFTKYAQEEGAGLARGFGLLPQQILPQALALYMKAARSPSPAAIRRAAVLTYELKGRGALEVVNKLDSPKLLKGLPAQDGRNLRRELAMWRDIYGGEISAREADDYGERIKGLNLGPVKAFALKQLYTRLGRTQLAEQAIDAAEQRSLGSVIPAVVLIFILGLTGLAGVVFILFYLSRLKRWIPHPEPREADGRREGEAIPSDILFRGFTAYIGTILALSVIASRTVVASVNTLPLESRLLSLVALEFGLSAASGAIGLLYLHGLVRRSGGSFAAIGLSLRDFGRSVLWGIAGFCALIPILAIVSSISNILTRVFFREVETPAHPIFPLLLSGDRIVFLLLFLTATVLAPFFEEIFFRGLLYNGLRERLSVVWAALISGAAFAIVHPQLPAGFLPILVMGAIFSLLVESRRSLIPSMIAHALNNGMIFLMMYFAFIR